MSKDTTRKPVRHSALNDWLSWLETLHPKEIDLGLERARFVANRLGLSSKPNNGAELVTVAGTNGKGSFVTSIQTLLNKSGARVGTYTSPHILAYNERIQIDGVPVHDDVICKAFEKIDEARLSEPEISLSYFEFATLAALIIFEEHGLDVWVLEVGLGGRLDATNIMDADIAVITSIAIDHQHFLGTTREAIAVEKAGIIRHGATVVCADLDPPQTLSRIISEKADESFFIAKDFSFELDETSEQLCRFLLGKKTLAVKHRPNLPLASVAASLKTHQLICHRRPQFQILSDEAKSTLVEGLSLAGRFERNIYNGVSVIFDVAHNPAATNHLFERLSNEEFGIGTDKKPLTCVVAMMEDKDVTKSLLPMLPVVASWFCTQVPNFPRSMTSEVLGEKVETLMNFSSNKSEIATSISIIEGFDTALQTAISFAKNHHHTVLIFGSFYAVAQAKQFFMRD